MIFLTGETTSRKIVPKLKEHGIGRVFVNKTPTPYEGEPWAFDNGAFIAWKNQKTWNADKYKRKLDKAHKVGEPLFAVIPDKVAQPDSLEYSMQWLDDLPNNWKWYFCLQDGMSFWDVKQIVCQHPRIEGLFLGGTSRFKSDFGREFGKIAQETNIAYHYGRTSSIDLICRAWDWGCDSCDSAFFLWNKTRMEAVYSLIKNNFKTRQLRLINSYVIWEKNYEEEKP